MVIEMERKAHVQKIGGRQKLQIFAAHWLWKMRNRRQE